MLLIFSSYNQLEALVGGKGPVGWLTSLVLIGLIVESLHTCVLYLSSSFTNFFSLLGDDMIKHVDQLDAQGQEDFLHYLKEMGIIYVKNTIIDEQNPHFAEFLKNLEKSLPTKRPSIEPRLTDIEKELESTNIRKLIVSNTEIRAQNLGRDLKRSFKHYVISGLTFLTYLIAVSLVLVFCLKNHFDSMFAWLIFNLN
jgi:hypothetical protein